jgi:hypothetical protein
LAKDDEAPPEEKENKLIPLFEVKAEQVDVGMSPEWPDMSIIHIATQNENDDIMALGLRTEAATKLYLGLGTLLKLQFTGGDVEGEDEDLTNIPKNKIN